MDIGLCWVPLSVTFHPYFVTGGLSLSVVLTVEARQVH